MAGTESEPTKPTSTEATVFCASPDEYGTEYRAHLLEQYKLYVEGADRVSARRMAANNYLLTVNSLLVTLYGLAGWLAVTQVWRLAVPITGVIVCFTWYVLIRSYRQLNSAKFKVIHELETRLPAALFDREWELAEGGTGKAYRPLTYIEPYIPVAFALLFVVLGIYAVLQPEPPAKSIEFKLQQPPAGSRGDNNGRRSP